VTDGVRPGEWEADSGPVKARDGAQATEGPMSLRGAMRLVVDGWQQPEHRRPDEPLAPIRSGAWADWARAATAGPAVEGDLGEACVTEDGRPGRIVAAHDGIRLVRVCEPT
jgi:hypothetical protein